MTAALAVAGCGGGDSSDPVANTTEPPAAAAPAAVNAAAPATTTAELEAQARAALAAVLPGAASAPLLGVRAGIDGAICGEVGTPAGFRGFIAAPRERPVIARAASLDLYDREDPYPPLYIRWCATSEELIALQPQLAAAAAAPDQPVDNGLEPIEPPPPAAEPAPPRPPLRGGERSDRFSDAVLRPDER